jgi:hypothetical protein
MTQAAILAASGSPGTTTGFKNRLINGNMNIDQRNNGSLITQQSGYTVDRWASYCTQASKLTFQQNSGNAPLAQGFSQCVKITSTSAYSVISSDFFEYFQYIEGNNIADLGFGTSSAKTVTLSFWVQSSLTGSFGGFVANSGATRIYPFSYTISAANTWQQISVTIPGDTSGTWLTTNAVGLQVAFGLGVGSNFNAAAGAWNAGTGYIPSGSVSLVGTSGATFYITGVQLEVGTTATNFDFRSINQELYLCKRYFENWGSNHPLPLPQNYSSTTDRMPGIQWEVEKRAAPSITFSSQTVCFLGQQTGGGSPSVSSISSANPTVWGDNYWSIAHSSTSGINRWNVDSGQYVWISAEL